MWEVIAITMCLYAPLTGEVDCHAFDAPPETAFLSEGLCRASLASLVTSVAGERSAPVASITVECREKPGREA